MIAIVGILFELVILALVNLLHDGTLDIGNLAASLAIAFATFFIIVSIIQNKRLKMLKGSLILGYFFRLFLVYFDRFGRRIFILPQISGDAEVFYYGAVSYASYGRATRTVYPKVMGTLFRLIGINRLFGQYLSMLCSIVGLVFLAYAMIELGVSDQSTKRVYRVACLLPHFALVSSGFIREAFIMMFLSISFYYFTRWIRRKNFMQLVIAMGFVLPASAFHSGTIAILAGYIVLLMLYDNRREAVHVRFSGLFLAALMLFAAAYILGRNEEVFLDKFGNVDSLADIANTNTEGGSSYAQYVGNSNNPVSLVVFTPLRMLYFLFSPFPWQWRGLSDIIMSLFGALYYLVATISAFKALRRKRAPNHGIIFALMILAMAAVFVFGWGVSNTGTASRHRDKLATLFALLWATSLDGLRPHVIPDEENIHYEEM